MPSTTLSAIARAAGKALDDLGTYAVGSSTSSTVVSASLVNGTANASGTLYNGAWVYSTYSGGQQARVRTGGYAPSTGTLTIYPSWTLNPPAASEIDVTHLFPRIALGPHVEDTDYRTLVVKGLRRLAFRDRITVAITTSETISLAAYLWLDRPERLLGVREPAPTGSLTVPADWRRPTLVVDGGTPALELSAPFAAASGNLTLDVLRPAHTLVNGAESTVGPVNENDAVALDLEDILPAVLLEAYAVLLHRAPGRADGANWAQKYEQQLQLAMASTWWDKTSMAPQAPREEAA